MCKRSSLQFSLLSSGYIHSEANAGLAYITAAWWEGAELSGGACPLHAEWDRIHPLASPRSAGKGSSRKPQRATASQDKTELNGPTVLLGRRQLPMLPRLELHS